MFNRIKVCINLAQITTPAVLTLDRTRRSPPLPAPTTNTSPSATDYIFISCPWKMISGAYNRCHGAAAEKIRWPCSISLLNLAHAATAFQLQICMLIKMLMMASAICW